MFDKTQVSILISFYEKQDSRIIPKLDDFYLTETGQEKFRESSFHMLELLKNGYLKFEGDPFLYGGQTSPKYNDSIVIDIDFRKINITESGINYLNKIKI